MAGSITITGLKSFKDQEGDLTFVNPNTTPRPVNNWSIPRWWYNGNNTVYEGCIRVNNSQTNHQIYISCNEPNPYLKIEWDGSSYTFDSDRKRQYVTRIFITTDDELKVGSDYQVPLRGAPIFVTPGTESLAGGNTGSTTGSVTIDGIPTQNQTLTANTSGLSDPAGIASFSYQWRSNNQAIAGATSNTLVLSQNEVGTTIRVSVTVTNNNDEVSTLTSGSTTPVANVNDSDTGNITLTGTPTQGETLTIDTSAVNDPDGLGAFSYQWFRDDSGPFLDGVAISGETSQTYTLTQSDVGNHIYAEAYFTDGYGQNETVGMALGFGPINNINDAPTGNVVITGNAAVGETVTADTSGISDPDGIGSFSYQWRKDNPPQNITGATSQSFVITSGEFGKVLSVQVQYTDNGGTTETLTSNFTEPVAQNNAATGTPVITGWANNPVIGNELGVDTSSIADLDGMTNATFAYEWRRSDSSTILGTSSTFTPTSTEQGKGITVTVTFTDDAGNSESRISTVTPAVVENSAPTGNVTVSGFPVPGETLTADTSTIADADGLTNVTFSYQWLKGNSNVVIEGATQSTYTVQSSDLFNPLSVRVTYTDNRLTTETLQSAYTNPVTNNYPPTGEVTITGTTENGETLTADTSTLADQDGLGTFSYQWKAAQGEGEATAISGATNSTYTLTSSEVGKQITVTVSYTDGSGGEGGEGNSESVTSAAVGPVTEPVSGSELSFFWHAYGTRFTEMHMGFLETSPNSNTWHSLWILLASDSRRQTSSNQAYVKETINISSLNGKTGKFMFINKTAGNFSDFYRNDPAFDRFEYTDSNGTVTTLREASSGLSQHWGVPNTSSARFQSGSTNIAVVAQNANAAGTTLLSSSISEPGWNKHNGSTSSSQTGPGGVANADGSVGSLGNAAAYVYYGASASSTNPNLWVPLKTQVNHTI